MFYKSIVYFLFSLYSIYNQSLLKTDLLISGWSNIPFLDEKLPICKAQEILKPECTTVHEATLTIWQNFTATQQMGEFSFKHELRNKHVGQQIHNRTISGSVLFGLLSVFLSCFNDIQFTWQYFWDTIVLFIYFHCLVRIDTFHYHLWKKIRYARHGGIW